MPDIIKGPDSPDWTAIEANNSRPNIPAGSTEDAEAPNINAPLPSGPMTLGGASAAPAAPAPAAPAEKPMHVKMAEGIMHALGGSDGKPFDWARATLSGGLAAAGSEGKVAPGQGALAGIGAGARTVMQNAREERANAQQQAQEKIANSQKQQELDLQKQREQREGSQFNQEMTLRKAEDARRQAESVRDAAVHEKRMAVLDQQIKEGNFKGLKEEADYYQGQADKFNALQKVGATQYKVNGATSPDFVHLGEAEDFARHHQDQVIGNHALQIVRNPNTGTYGIYEVPNEGPTMREITDASGKTMQILATPGEYLDKQEQIAKTKHYMNVAAKSSQELKEEVENYKEEGSVKGANKELDKVSGDYTQLKPASREILLNQAHSQFLKAQTGLEKELAKGELADKTSVEQLTKLRDYYAGLATKIVSSHPSNVAGSPAPAAAPGKATGTPAFTAMQAPNGQQPPKPGYVYGKGAKGEGWYKAPTPAPAAATAPAQTGPAPITTGKTDLNNSPAEEEE